ncbi:hypothetical protein ACNOYE_27690 [Nannocystaceae bacterium ST9]
MMMGLLVLGCEQDETIRLIPVAGCGLDQTFSGLRIRVLGDFPPSSTTELLLAADESGRIDRLPDGAQGIAAEGVFGMTITAIGRSYGIDPELARGRIAGESGPLLPIWFAAPDSMCAVPGTIAPRSDFAWAEAASGDVLILGGRDASGLRGDSIHYDVLANRSRALGSDSASARVGHSLHGLDERRFVALGGARANEVLADALVVTLSEGDPQIESRALAGPLAHHAAALGPASEAGVARVLVAGGCREVDALGQCSAEVHAEAAWIELSDEPTSEPLPELESARADAHALVARDAVAFVGGGVDEFGVGLGSVERLAPGDDAWQTIVEFDVDALAGMTVLDGELVIVADVDGDLHWWSPGGSGTLDPSLRAPMLTPALGPRPMLGLAGERVLVDTWLFAPGSAAVDPSAEIVDLVGNVSGEPTPARTGGALLELRDGTALLAGGTALGPGELPFLARVRPALEGPDEQVPELATPRSDAFVGNTPAAAAVIVGGLRLTGVGSPDELPRVHAHVRGFRSRSFRLEFALGSEQGNTASVMVGQGATLALIVALSPAAVEVRLREADGDVVVLDCGGEPFMTEFPAVLEVGEAGQRVRVLQSDRVVVDCSLVELDPWPDPGGLHVAFGLAGPGDRTFRSLRLARL